MEFALSENQRMLQDSVNGYLETASPLDAVRLAADGDAGVTATITDGLAELGVNQILVPEDNDGLGLGLLDAALVQEALGASVAPARFVAQAVSIIGLKTDANSAQQSEWLSKAATGDVKFGLAISEQTGAREDAGVEAASGKLTGKSLFALETATATHILVADKQGGLHIVARDADGLNRTSLATIDRTRDYAELTFSNTPALALAGDTQSALANMIQAGRILIAADSLGAASSMLAKAVDYAKERKQFNRVIGSFQAVKHMCAEMAAHLEPARALVWHAAHAFDQGDEDAALMACLVKSHMAEIGTFIARTSTEVYGGMGFTDLVGLHYWFKRIGANRQLLGSPERVREDAAKLQGWT